MPVTLFLHTDRNNDKKTEITLWMENCFQLLSSFPLIWNMAHSPDWKKKELWQLMLKQFFFLLGSCNSTVWLFPFFFNIEPLWFYFDRWRYSGRVRALSRWVFTWWSRAASLCSSRLSCKVCPFLSLSKPGEELWAQDNTAFVILNIWYSLIFSFSCCL